MEAFKKKIRLQRNMGFIIGVLLLVCAIGIMYFPVYGTQIASTPAFIPAHEAEGSLGHALGFVSGVSTGIGLVALFFAFRCFFALRNETKLKAMYIKQNDERLAAARNSAFTVGACISIVSILIAAIVAMFFNQTVAVTLIAVIYFSALVLVICKIIYVKKS